MNEPTNTDASKLAQLHVVSNGYQSTPKSLVLAFDHTRLLVNCGEGTQRVANSLGLKLYKINNILLTRFEWRSISGIMGLSMHMTDSRATMEANVTGSRVNFPRIAIHCPLDLRLKQAKEQSMKKFLMERSFPLDQFDHEKAASEGGGMGMEYRDKDVAIRRFVMSESKGIWSYLIRVEKSRPRFDEKKCEEMGIRRGKWIQEVLAGKDVTIGDRCG
jgi:ribonuclease BN (tRNA processing enzyme)